MFPPRTSRVEIDYTVLNLTSALKTRFRYRLDGFDSDWIDAGTRQQAFYTNLPPRDYAFRVMASAADGTFSEPATVWRFAIQPMFYQTTWFLVTVGFAAVVFGHSHKPSTETRDGVLYINPGSAGPRRFSLPVTVARLRVTGAGLEPEIVDLDV